MAEMEEIDNLDDAPSTPPPNTNNIAPNSIRRESTCLRTPILRPGFVPTSSDSRRAVIPPKKKTKTLQSSRATTTVIEDESGSESSNIVHTTNNSKRNAQHKDGQQAFLGVQQVASHTGEDVHIDTAQDLDEANAKAPTNKNKRKILIRTAFCISGSTFTLKAMGQS
ncbi:hypothetical protein PCANC_27813, partial [Puccinia coronata f. sp. avenae]